MSPEEIMGKRVKYKIGKKDKKVKAAVRRQFRGIFHSTTRGFGFITPEGGENEEDIFYAEITLIIHPDMSGVTLKKSSITAYLPRSYQDTKNQCHSVKHHFSGFLS